MNTIHKVPASPIGIDTRPIELKVVDLSTTDPQLSGPTKSGRRKRFAIGASICAVSLAAGALVEHWALTYQGHYQVTPLAIILLPAVVVAFLIPEAVEVASRRRAARSSLGRGLVGHYEGEAGSA